MNIPVNGFDSRRVSVAVGNVSLAPERTIVITGVARGGTSLVASICHHLGIPMGKSGPRYENPWLQRAVLASNLGAMQTFIDVINNHWLVWGWKLPALTNHLEAIQDCVRNPHLIFVFKDPSAVAFRKTQVRTLQDSAVFVKHVGRALAHYQRMQKFAAQSGARCLLVSFERAAKDMPGAVSEIAEFCGISNPDIKSVVEGAARDSLDYRSKKTFTYPFNDIDWRLLEVCRDRGIPEELWRLPDGIAPER